MADGRVIIEAILDTANVTKNVGNLGKELNGISWKNIAEGDKKAQALGGAFTDAGTACTMKLTAPIAAAGAVAFGVASDYQQAAGQIQTSLGLTSQEAERFKDIGAKVYEGAWGDSMTDVSDAIVKVRQNMGDMDDATFQNVTESAFMLRDAFDADINESTRAARALMKNFGVTGTEAMDLITTGFQKGGDYSGEFLDTISEYSTQFANVGLDANQMFDIMISGAEAGAWNMDKVGDAVKEFHIRAQDGSSGTAEGFAAIGLNAEEMGAKIAAGGEDGEQAYMATLTALAAMDDEVARNQAGVALFGTQWEDLNESVVASMTGNSGAMDDFAGSADRAKEAACDNFAAKSEEAMRTVLGSLEPLGEPLLNIAEKVAGVVKSFGEWFGSIGEHGQTAVLVIGGIVAAIGPLLGVVGHIIGIIPTITGLLGGAGTAAGAAGAGTGALSGALTAITGPIGIVIGVVAALVALFVHLWNTNEEFRNAVTTAWNSIMTTIMGIIDQVRPYIEQAWIAIQNAITTAMEIIVPIVSEAFMFLLAVIVPTLQSILETVGSVFTVILSTISGVMGGISSVIEGVWNVICGIVQTVCGLIHGIVTGDFSQMQAGIDQIMNGISSIIDGVWNTISSVIEGVINTIGQVITGGLNAAKSSVEGIFNGIKGIIDNVMGGAQNIVSDALNNIANFFSNLTIQWPHIPMPHFSVSGSFNLDPFNFSVPSIGINWYAKGGVFNGASIIGVGEAGAEAVVPLTGKRMQPFAEAIAGQIGGGGNGGVKVEIKIENFNNYSDKDLEALVDKIMRDIQRKLAQQKRAKGYA